MSKPIALLLGIAAWAAVGVLAILITFNIGRQEPGTHVPSHSGGGDRRVGHWGSVTERVFGDARRRIDNGES